MSLMTLHCPECRDDRMFEPPHDPAACPDRADSPCLGCPELACIDCGTAMMVGFAVPAVPLVPAAARSAADRLHRRPERAA